MFAFRRALAGGAMVLIATVSPQAHAALWAHLEVYTIDDIGRVGEAEQFTTDENDPGESSVEPEPFWALAVLDYDPETDPDGNVQTSTMPNCSSSVTTTQSFDFSAAPQTLSLQMPGEGSEAWFYIGLYEYDSGQTGGWVPKDNYAEILGDHWWSGAVEQTESSVANNNDALIIIPGAGGFYCGLYMVYDESTSGVANNWDATFRSFYTDDTPPSAATSVAHAAGESYNDDGTLTFAWTRGADADSGIRQEIEISSESGGSCVRTLTPTATSYNFTGAINCNGGGTMTLTEAESYSAVVRTCNGVNPVTDNPACVDSDPSNSIIQAAQDPVPAISMDDTWHTSSFTVAISDTATADSCQFRVLPETGWRERTCNSEITVPVESEGCLTQGSCVVEAWAESVSSKVGTSQRSFLVDWEAEPIDLADFHALDAPPPDNETTITSGQWQSDSSPYFWWSDPTSGASAAEYVRGFSTSEPDCDCQDPDNCDEAPTFTQESALADGSYLFWVRVIDEAGNCSVARSFTLKADTAGDAVGPVSAYEDDTASPEVAIVPATWQTDNTPYFDWDTVTGDHAPITGYAVGFGANPANCSSTQAATFFEVSTPRADGMHTFNVRARDQAGNCGPKSSFTLYIDHEKDTVDLVTAEDSLGEDWDAGEWRDDTLPTFSWTATSSAGNTLSFSHALALVSASPDPDCTAEGSATTFQPESPLADGLYRFSVRTVDLADNCGDEAEWIDVGVDTHAESISDLAGEEDDGSAVTGAVPTNDPTPLFTWSTDRDAAIESPVAYAADMDLDDWGDLCQATTFASPSYQVAEALDEGEHAFGVRAIDSAGHCGELATLTFTVDTEAPALDTFEIFDDEISQNPIAASTWQVDQDPYVTWTLETPEEGVEYMVRVDDTTPPTTCVANREAADYVVATGQLDTRQHTVTVWAIDVAGNCGGPLEIPIWVDVDGDAISTVEAHVAAPATAGNKLAEGQPQPDADPYFVWTVNWPSETDGAPLDGYFFALDAPAGCISEGAVDTATAAHQIASPLEDATYTFNVAARDTAGNCGPEKSFELVVLASAPLISDMSVSPDPARADVDVTIRFSVDRTLGENPNVSINDIRIASFESEDQGVYTYIYRTLGTEAQGTLPIDIVVEDEIGNSGANETTVTFDFTKPTLTELVADPPVVTTGDTTTISIRTSETLLEAPEVLINGIEATAAEPTLDEDVWSHSYFVLGTETEGGATITVTGTDLAGNERTVTGRLDFDFTEPEVELLYPTYREVLNLGDEMTLEWATIDAFPATVDIALSRDGGETFPELMAENLEDTGSTTWVVAGEPTTDAVFRVTATDRVGLTGTDMSDVPSRIRESVADHLILTAEESSVTVGDTVPVTVQIVDALGDPVAVAAEVTLTVDKHATIVSNDLTDASEGEQTITGMTHADGLATLTVTSLVADTVTVAGSGDFPEVVPDRNAEIAFVPAGPDHLGAFTDDASAPIGGTELVLIQVLDREGNPVSAAVPVTVQLSGQATFVGADLNGAAGLGTSEINGGTSDEGSGHVVVRDFVEELVTVTPASTSTSLTLEVAHEPTMVSFVDEGGVNPITSRITAEPDVVYADDVAVSIITVEPLNGVGDRIGAGLTVEVESTFGTLDDVTDNGDGTYQTALSSSRCEADPARVTAEVEGIHVGESAQVRFTCEAVADAELLAEPAIIPGDGAECATLVVRPLDAEGEVLGAGHAIQFFPSFGQVGDVVDVGDGSYSAQFCSTECNESVPARIDVSVDGVPLVGLSDALHLEVGVACILVDPSASTLTADPLELLADGEAASTILVAPIDIFGEPMGTGLDVEVLTTHGDLTHVEDLEDGTYRALLTSSEPGTAAVTVRINGVPLETGADILFNPARPAFPGSTAVTVTQELLGGELMPQGNATITARVRSNLSYDLANAYLVLTLDDHLAFKAGSLRVGNDGGVGSEVSQGLRIDLGTLPSRLAPNASEGIEVRYEVRFDADASGTLIATLQSFVDEDTRGISEQSRLSLPVASANELVAGGEACGCDSASGSGGLESALPWLLALMGVGVTRRKRRHR